MKIANRIKAAVLIAIVYALPAISPLFGVTTWTTELRQYNGTGWVPLQLAPVNSLAGGLLQMNTSGTPSFQTSPTTTSLNISGTGGTGFLDLTNQGSDPTPGATSHNRLFMDSAGVFTFYQTSGSPSFWVKFNAQANSANRTYTLPDASGTVALSGGSGTFSNVIINGTGGSGYLKMVGQSSNPTLAASNVFVWGNNSNQLSFSNGLNNNVASFDTTALTASKVYTWPDANSTIPIATQVITFAGVSAPRTITFPNANITVARTDAGNTFTGVQTIDDGTAGTPTINFASQTNLGVFKSASGKMGFAAGGGLVEEISTTGVSITGNLVLASGTTIANGISLGDTNLFRAGTTTLQTNATFVTVPNNFAIGINSSNSFGVGGTLQVNVGGNVAADFASTSDTFKTGGTTALTLDSSQNTLASGDIKTTTIGKTLAVKSGANSLAGTVTLVAGSATITSSAIDTNTVIIFSEKTAGGTPSLYQPLATVSAGSAAVTGAVTDTSTYNWVALKIN